MDPATVELINKEFVPLVSLDWGFGEILTAHGEVITKRLQDGDTGGPNGKNNPFAPKRLLAALAKFKQLPAEKRTAKAEELPAMWKGKAEMAPPAGGLILKQYRRVLQKDADGKLYRGDIYHDSLWMTQAEWQSLVPEKLQVGDYFPVPAFLLKRIGRHHAQILNPSACVRLEPTPKPLLTLTVEEVLPELLRLRLHGSFRVTEYQIPDTNGVFDFQVSGCLHYDVKKKVFTRFDMVAFGDVTNLRKDGTQPPKGRTLVAGLLFELSPGATPWERTPPYDAVSMGGKNIYFKGEK
jgi:hypothetical protein